ncbi:UDP-N-acetylmuramate dehydrogenase [Fusibacter sp. 3D3]|uniref:UDP-N-acetylmuramate dehydrogenase n=1 Tax=Fusibacter sp. 3D3 TaxID=1048380 RepID=UPI000858A246|nr:UDP-N-acetylmuramate dehydrogenase [Fusibacter sp. 3D3]GAU78044.1 UDP-N-acetylenolpyruvoylglucosamine reductase [Fusibacter sp. 3D3]
MKFEPLTDFLDQEQILRNEQMKVHTSFKIGGHVDCMVLPRKVEDIKQTINFCKAVSMPYHIMGNGSNILVDDDGIEGLVIKISDAFSAVDVQDEVVIAEAGVLLSKLSKVALRNSLKGFEFASGIPGTLGGAIFMNAGAYGGEMKDVIQWVEVLTASGEVQKIQRQDMAFGYRTSIVKANGFVVLRAALKLQKGNYEEILAITQELTEKRVSKQPVDLPSAGSTFKRPEGHYAGRLIEDSGLRGLKYGHAMVSEKHCGFVVNTGEASCKEVITLIEIIQKVVRDRFEVELEREVRIFGKE